MIFIMLNFRGQNFHFLMFTVIESIFLLKLISVKVLFKITGSPIIIVVVVLILL